MNRELLASGIVIILIGMVAWLQQNPIHIKWSDIKGSLSSFKHWLYTGDKDVVYPVVVASSFALVVIVSCLLEWF